MSTSTTYAVNEIIVNFIPPVIFAVFFVLIAVTVAFNFLNKALK